MRPQGNSRTASHPCRSSCSDSLSGRPFHCITLAFDIIPSLLLAPSSLGSIWSWEKGGNSEGSEAGGARHLCRGRQQLTYGGVSLTWHHRVQGVLDVQCSIRMAILPYDLDPTTTE